MNTVQNKKWSIKEKNENKQIQSIASELSVSPLFVELCLNRGLTTKDEITRFLHPDESWFHDPYLLNDMEKAVERISAAIENGENIMIYGDYDADGVTSTAILYETLEAIGGAVNYFIPNRFVEGYGPNKEAFERFYQDGTQLIITVDNGVAGHEAIHYIQDKGIDVIVTDHHELPESLPEAYGIIHPNHPKGQYPFGDLSGAGVALKLATALMGELPSELLDLAAIGTVADLVSLKDENRAIVKYGINAIKQSQRVGILSLFDALSLSMKEIDETTIGFKIAPPINAIGRLENAGPVVELLTTFDEERASEIAHLLDTKNKERKGIVSEITAEAMEQLAQQQNTPVYVLAKEGWHEGVLGIVASRIVNETGKPTIVLNLNPETKEAKGSGRSIKAFNLFEHCNEVRQLFKHFGGHHMAAGMTLPIDNIDSLHKALNKAAEKVQESTDFSDEIEIEVESSIADIDIASIREMDKLKPFGTDNPKPVFVFKDVRPIESRSIGADSAHLKMRVGQNDGSLDVIAFNYGSLAEALKTDSTISIAGTLDINEWNGNKKSQMQLMDLKFNEPVLIDKRTTELKKADFRIENVVYVFFNKKTYAAYHHLISEMSESLLIETTEEAADFLPGKPYVLVDCPDRMELLKSTIQGNARQALYCIFYTEENHYLAGMPSRKQFADLYKFLAKHKSIDLKEKGTLLAQYLKLDKNILKFIIRVFLEAKFVTIDNGLLRINADAEKMNVEETAIYQNRNQRIKIEEVLVYSSFNELAVILKGMLKTALE